MTGLGEKTGKPRQLNALRRVKFVWVMEAVDVANS